MLHPLSEVASPPPGFTRVELPSGSFGAFLRAMPMRPSATPVFAYDGAKLLDGDDPRLFRVADLDVGARDLQQCADSVIRWHAEWLWSRAEGPKAAYHFVSGDLASFARYAAGDRPVVIGNRVSWERRAKARSDRTAYRSYLDVVFTYASTLSLAREARTLAKEDASPGDFFVLPGGPGHAILILDIAQDANGRRIALLGQGYMPAQDFHVLASRNPSFSPWFSLDGDAVDTPFWSVPFPWSSLRRFR